MPEVRRKCFISYHHADQAEVDQFVRDFDHNNNCFISRGLGQEMSQDIIDSTDTDYVMRRIRERFLRDSTVTIVMLGECTWARRYVDWEIQASLRRGESTVPNGLLGVKLPSYPDPGGSFPQRFNSNLMTDENKKKGGCYARHMTYPSSVQALVDAIEAAHQRRTTHAQYIVNPREKFSYNRQCQHG